MPGTRRIKVPRKYRLTDPETSRLAANSLSPEKLRASQLDVLVVLRRHGPLSDEAIYERLLRRQSVSGARTRRKELVDLGLVRDSGDRDVTASGRQTIIWEIADE